MIRQTRMLEVEVGINVGGGVHHELPACQELISILV
jgi:hypothetical protein